MATRDLYSALGVSETASTDEIRKAYRTLARTWHPDVNAGDRDAEERFKTISRAHDVLGDPKKRRLYDEFGEEGLRAGFDPGRARGAEAFRRAAGAPSFEDILGDLFGARRAARRTEARGADIEHTLEIGLVDALRGTTAQVAVTRPCRACGGSGRTGLRECRSCQGRGWSGAAERLNVKIPAGVDQGSRIRVAGKGAPGRAGGPPGDLYIVTRVRPHPLLERRGLDLVLPLPITVGEAIEGATVTVPTPAGPVKLKVPPGTQSGTRLRLRGKGAPSMHGPARGDLYVVAQVQVPTDGDAGTRDAVRVLEASYARSPRADLRL